MAWGPKDRAATKGRIIECEARGGCPQKFWVQEKKDDARNGPKHGISLLLWICIIKEVQEGELKTVVYSLQASCRCVLGECESKLGRDGKRQASRTAKYYKSANGNDRYDAEIEDVEVQHPTRPNETHFVTVFK